MPSSKHAIISQAFAGPNPGISFKSLKIKSGNFFAPNFFNISPASSIAFISLFPDRKRKAKSSELESFSGPY